MATANDRRREQLRRLQSGTQVPVPPSSQPVQVVVTTTPSAMPTITIVTPTQAPSDEAVNQALARFHQLVPSDMTKWEDAEYQDNVVL